MYRKTHTLPRPTNEQQLFKHMFNKKQIWHTAVFNVYHNGHLILPANFLSQMCFYSIYHKESFRSK